MIYLSTWMYEESAKDGGYYFQVGGNASAPAKKLIYWRCVLLFFTLAYQKCRQSESVQLCLFTNIAQLPIVDGVDLRSYLESINVKIIQLDYRWRPRFPKKEWYNQFYVFDILDYFEVSASDSDHFIISDSDCMAVENLDPLFDSLAADGYLTMTVGTTPDEDINGITRRQAATLYGPLGGPKQPLIAPYYGGEFFGISGQLLGPFLALSRDAFEVNNRRAESGRPYLTEEAHLLSYAFVQLGVIAPNADGYIRRIWTSWKSNNTIASDLELLIWHVPAEKIFGIAKLAKRYASSIRKNRPVSETSKGDLSIIFGVGKRRFLKVAHTFAYAVIRRARQHLKAQKSL